MNKPNISVVFDYTSFLGASCQQKWTFVEAFHFFSSSESSVKKRKNPDQYELECRLWSQALHVLSTRQSDETNLLELIAIARAEGVAELKLLMPYDLEPEQLSSIRQHSKDIVNDLEHDELLITL